MVRHFSDEEIAKINRLIGAANTGEESAEHQLLIQLGRWIKNQNSHLESKLADADRANDIVMDALLSVMKAVRTGKVKNWGDFTERSLSHINQRIKVHPVETEKRIGKAIMDSYHYTPSDPVMLKEIKQEVQRLRDTSHLTAKEFAVLRSGIDGVPLDEIAAEEKVGIGAVRARYVTAIDKMYQSLRNAPTIEEWLKQNKLVAGTLERRKDKAIEKAWRDRSRLLAPIERKLLRQKNTIYHSLKTKKTNLSAYHAAGVPMEHVHELENLQKLDVIALANALDKDGLEKICSAMNSLGKPDEDRERFRVAAENANAFIESYLQIVSEPLLPRRSSIAR